jgi:hypothetical protein
MRWVQSLLWLLIVVLTLMVACGAAVLLLRPSGEVAPPAWADDYDLTAQPPEAIAPGTVVERGPPAGWSHLVIKSLPRVKGSEVPKLPKNPLVSRDETARRVGWMFTVFTADVVEERHGAHKRHRLRAIGLGLGANVNGRDTVLTVDWARETGTKIDEIQKLTLTTGYNVQKQSRVVLHGPSFALVDTPVTFRCGTTNRAVRFRYALLVDAPTGRLDVLCWRIGAEGGECADLGRAVLMNPDTIDEAELIPDLSGFDVIGIPGELAFGVDDLPPYRLEVALPSELATLAGKTRYAPEEAHALEAGLRKLLPGRR